MNREIVRHLAKMLGRVRRLDNEDERHGLNRGRTAESSALNWAIDHLGEEFPEELGEAKALLKRDRSL